MRGGGCQADFENQGSRILFEELALYTALPYNLGMVFIETSTFTKLIYDYLKDSGLYAEKDCGGHQACLNVILDKRYWMVFEKSKNTRQAKPSCESEN